MIAEDAPTADGDRRARLQISHVESPLDPLGVKGAVEVAPPRGGRVVVSWSLGAKTG